MLDTISPFNDLMDNAPRVKQQIIVPTGVRTANLFSNFIQNSTSSTSTFSIGNGVGVTLTTTITSKNPKVPLMAVLEVAFYEGDPATTAMLIPFGTGIAVARYVVTGPIAMPAITGGSDGNNMVFKTNLVNNSGSTQTIRYYTQLRFVQGIGGGAS